jgi:hypothetical protein
VRDEWAVTPDPVGRTKPVDILYVAVTVHRDAATAYANG